jgi:hypothetical protein
VQLEPPAGVGADERPPVDDGSDQLAQAHNADPGIGGGFALAQAQPVADNGIILQMMQAALPAEMIEPTARVEPQPRRQVFERVGDIESVGGFFLTPSPQERERGRRDCSRVGSPGAARR